MNAEHLSSLSLAGETSPLHSLTVFSVPRANPQNNQSTTRQEWHSLY
jgi:hypothetical protein